MIHEVLFLLEDILGSSSPVNKKEISFYCPNCKHHKKKLQVSPTLGYYHCWVCHFKGRNLESLINRSCKLKGIPQKRIEGYNTEIKKINFTSIRSINDIKESFLDPNVNYNYQKVTLPNKCIPILQKDNFIYRRIRNYLYLRGFNDIEFERYNIRYCEDENDLNYVNRIIFPSYNSNGSINTFNARSIDGVFPKYREPSEVNKSAIIGFENLININLPIVLVEGMFDAKAVKFNSIPIFGTYLTTKTKKLLTTLKNKVYICLDPEAFEYSIQICELLFNDGVDVYHTILPSGTDPSSLGHINVWKYINQSIKVSREYIFKQKIIYNL